MGRHSAAAVVWICLVVLSGKAQEASADGLTDLLIEKGIITQEELKKQQATRWLKVEGRIQFRYTWHENDDPKDNTSEFTLPRVRLGVSGAAFENVQFKLEADFAPDPATDASGNVKGGSKVSLTDAKLSFTHFEHAPLTVGHFKVPFSRQQLTSTANMQFINRAAVIGGAQRDIGIMVGDYMGKGLFEYAVGAFNGTNTANLNDNTGFLVTGRVAVNPWGEFSYSEPNLTGERMNVSIGFNVQSNKTSTAGTDGDLLTDDDVDTDIIKYGVDLGIKFLKRASFFAEYITARFDREGAEEYDANGWYVQGGYFLLPKRLESTARYEEYDPDDLVDDTKDIRWTTVGLNYFFQKYDWKVLADYIFKDEEHDPSTGKGKDDDTLLIQLEVRF